MQSTSITDLQLRRYEKQLSKIQEEHEKGKALRDAIEIENNKLITLKLSIEKSARNLAYVSVKVFSSLEELLSLYKSELSNGDWKDIKNSAEYNYYLIEINSISLMQRKLQNFNAHLNIVLRSPDNSVCFCNSSSLTDGDSILRIMPVNKSIVECSVTTFISVNNDTWIVINLPTVDVDASYHLEKYEKRLNPDVTTCNDRTVSIAKMYVPDVDQYLNDFPFEIAINLRSTLERLVTDLVEHSYHSLDMEIIRKLLNDSKPVVKLSLMLGGRRLMIIFNKDTKALEVKSHYQNSTAMKKMFLLRYGAFQVDDVKNGYQTLKTVLLEDISSLEELLGAYEDCRKIWLKSTGANPAIGKVFC